MLMKWYEQQQNQPNIKKKKSLSIPNHSKEIHPYMSLHLKNEKHSLLCRCFP
jgi:hypothetical protein